MIGDCDLVMRQRVEKAETKRKIFHDVCAVLKAGSIVRPTPHHLDHAARGIGDDRPIAQSSFIS